MSLCPLPFQTPDEYPISVAWLMVLIDMMVLLDVANLQTAQALPEALSKRIGQGDATVSTATPVRKLKETVVPEAEFSDSSCELGNFEALRRSLDHSGYLFLRSVLNRERLLRVRQEILELCREHGWLDSCAPLLDGVYSGVPFPDYNREYMPMYRMLLRLESFNRLARTSELMDLFANLLQGKVLCHPRVIARVSFPMNYAFTTQPHQDFHYIRGTTETYTAWIPAGDCPHELGGLALAEGSHRLGYLPHDPAVGAGGRGIQTSKLKVRWLAADFRQGDVLIFHSHTIHGALENHSPDRLRLSLDYRYQLAANEIHPDSLKPHGG